MLKKIPNCVREGNCGAGYECCSERIPSGGKPTFGQCCKIGMCNRETGHCRDDGGVGGSKDLGVFTGVNVFEGYKSTVGEGEGGCGYEKCWVRFLGVFCIVLFLAVILRR